SPTLPFRGYIAEALGRTQIELLYVPQAFSRVRAYSYGWNSKGYGVRPRFGLLRRGRLRLLGLGVSRSRPIRTWAGEKRPGYRQPRRARSSCSCWSRRSQREGDDNRKIPRWHSKTPAHTPIVCRL